LSQEKHLPFRTADASAGDGLEGSFERTISELKGVKPAVSPELAHECGDLGSEP
jgi:hypothetical protein